MSSAPSRATDAEPGAAAANGAASSTRNLLRRGRTVLRSRKRSEQRVPDDRRSAPETEGRASLASLAQRMGDAKRRGSVARAIPRSLLLRKASAQSPLGARPPHHRPGANGRFSNPWDSAGRRGSAPKLRVAGGSRTFFGKPSARERPAAEEVVAAMLLLADAPDFSSMTRAVARDSRALASVWLGHCTFLMRLQRLTVLTDPVWSSRLGPFGPRRLVQPVCAPQDVPATIDVVLLSSANADHFDRDAVVALVDRVQQWLVPLGVRELLIEAGVPEDRVAALDWWEEKSVGGAKIVCTPAQHYSTRENALWCSWVVATPVHSLFYCGGTGYRALDRNIDDCESFEHRKTYGGPGCPAFKEIARRFGRFDTAFLPLGHYKPRSALAAFQGDPVDMLFVHRDLKARRSIAHRWGTFAGTSSESLLDPVRALESAIIDSPVSEHEFTYLRHGKVHVT